MTEDVSDSPMPRLAPRDPRAHKGDFGRAMIVAGSRGMGGAAGLAGLACLRSGAGRVTVATPACVRAEVAGYSPCYTTHPLVDDDDFGVAHWANVIDLQALADQYDVWAVGPGLGQPFFTADLPGRMNRDWRRPVVIDADGLNGLVEFERRWGVENPGPPGPRVLTPHAGEFARLVGEGPLAAMARGDDPQRAEAAATLALRDPSGQTVVVLKGARTVITDGRRVAVNTTGNPGMATGGAGDVLTGVITALLCQGLAPFDAARLGVYLHGLAGDLAAARVGVVSLIASDVVEALPEAFQRLAGAS